MSSAVSLIESIGFLISFTEYKNAITGETELIEIDFTGIDGVDAEAEIRYEDGDALKVDNLKELKSKIRRDEHIIDKYSKIKKYKSPYKTWGGKALRYIKGQKDGKGGQIMPIEMQQIFRNIAKDKKISIKKAIKDFQNKDVLKINPVKTIGQTDWQDRYNYRTKKMEDGLISEITNPNLVVKVFSSDREVYSFYGSGREIYDNPNFQLIMNENLGKVYTAIKEFDPQKDA